VVKDRRMARLELDGDALELSQASATDQERLQTIVQLQGSHLTS
jgi:hypothetical protein